MSRIPSTMKAAVLTGHGGSDRLEIREDVTVPTPGPCDVLIRVAAAAVNNTDINTREGWYSKSSQSGDQTGWNERPMQFPRIQGADVCGHIVSVGDRVSPTRIEERVIVDPIIRETECEPLYSPWYFGSECDGGFAEYTVVPSANAYTVGSGLSDIELASFPCSYSTAENLVSRSQVGAGQVVVVTGASGGVGSAVVQLAAARGATIWAVTSERKADQVRSLGAERIAFRGDDLSDSFGRNGVDVVIDLIAGPTFPSLLRILRPHGTYAVSGAIGGAIVELDVRTLYLKDLRLLGCTVLDEDVFPNLIARIEAGEISPLVFETFPLANIVEAQATFLQKRHVGKIVLTIGGGER